MQATIILILKLLDVFPNSHIGKDKSWLFWYVLILQGHCHKHMLYSSVFWDDKSFLNIAYLNNPDINIKSKMAIINLYTGRDKVCHFVCILILYDPYCSQNLCFMILWTDNFILFIPVTMPIK